MTTEPTVPVSLLARVHHLEFQIGQMKITRSNDVDRMVTTMKSLSERISRLEDRLHGIESGEPPTGKSTTPTCAPIGSVTEEMIEAGVDASENIFESVSNEAAAIIYRAMEAEKGKG